MGRTAVLTICLTLSCCAAYSQPAGPALSFEVASVKPSPPVDPNKGIRVGCTGGPGTKDPTRWTCQNMTVSNLISNAYNLSRYQMPDQPGIFDADRYEITAKLPESTTREQFREMQRSLLKERFKLTVHFEKKEMPGFELVLAKGGPKLKEAEPPKPTPEDTPPPVISSANRNKEGFPIIPRGGRGMIMVNGKASWGSPDATVEQIATMLGGQLNRPVTDATGLSGKYEVVLMWSAENAMRGPAIAAQGPDSGAPIAAEPDGGPSLPTAIQDQLGLKLQPKRTPVDVLVIDHVEKAPTEN